MYRTFRFEIIEGVRDDKVGIMYTLNCKTLVLFYSDESFHIAHTFPKMSHPPIYLCCM